MRSEPTRQPDRPLLRLVVSNDKPVKLSTVRPTWVLPTESPKLEFECKEVRTRELTMVWVIALAIAFGSMGILWLLGGLIL